MESLTTTAAGNITGLIAFPRINRLDSWLASLARPENGWSSAPVKALVPNRFLNHDVGSSRRSVIQA
jgi:hypothetical protein